MVIRLLCILYLVRYSNGRAVAAVHYSQLDRESVVGTTADSDFLGGTDGIEMDDMTEVETCSLTRNNVDSNNRTGRGHQGYSIVAAGDGAADGGQLSSAAILQGLRASEEA